MQYFYNTFISTVNVNVLKSSECIAYKTYLNLHKFVSDCIFKFVLSVHEPGSFEGGHTSLFKINFMIKSVANMCLEVLSW